MPVELIIYSPAVQRVVEHANRFAVAPQTTTILITGETGTGKDLLATHIHEQSGAKGPHVSIDCAALPEALIESELFGHERGAFTGAVSDRAGRLEAAAGGTIVLDGVAALPMDAQAKLLRLLDERRFTRLGGSTPIELGARIIALANIDLEAAMAAGAFRRDLYFRLNVVSLHLPPLRENGDGIRVLAEHFADRFAHGAVGGRTQIAPESIEAMAAYDFPGNIRELRNILERASIECGGGTLSLDALPTAVRQSRRSHAARSLAEVEARHILDVLSATGDNKSEAARILGISRKSLYERLRRMRDANA